MPRFMGGLPKTIDALKLAEGRGRLCGILPAAALARLTAAVERIEGDIQVDLTFAPDAQCGARITGTVHAVAVMTCQRCLAAMRVVLNCRVALGVVFSEDQARRLGERPEGRGGRLEPLLLDGEQAQLDEIVEDELLLGLPTVALHEVCEPPGAAVAGAAESGEAQKHRPFVALKSLRL